MLIAVGLTLLPIAAVVWAWAMGAVNVPKWDDHALKAFLFAFDQETTFTGAVGEFVKQHNEHRIAYDRFFAWIDRSLFGKLSFVRLMAYGNLSLLGLVGLLGAVLARYRKDWYLFMPPLALVLVSLAHWENLYWAMSALQNFGVIFWSLWSLYALAYRKSPALAIGLATIATLVSGNGLLVWPVGVIVLLGQRRFILLPYWLGAAGILFAFYFWDYSQPKSNPPVQATWLELATGWLAFLGAAVAALPSPNQYILSVLFGGLLIGFWVYVCVRMLATFWRGEALSPLNSFALGVISFIIITAAVVVLGRYGFGKDTLLTSRYRIYSLTLLGFTYIYCLSVTYKKYFSLILISGFLIGGLCWWSAFVVNTHDSLSLRRYLLTRQYNWTYTTNRPVSSIDAKTNRLINSAPAYYDAVLPALFAPFTGAAFPIDSVFKTDQEYVVRLSKSVTDSVGVPTLSNPDRGVSLLLRSPSRTYLFDGLPVPQRNWRILVGLLPRYSGSPIEVSIPATDLEPGTYELAVVACQNSHSCQVRPTHQLLTVAPHAMAQKVNTNW